MITKLKTHSDTAHKTLAHLQAIAEDLNKQHRKALITGTDNATVDAIELEQKMNAREIVRATEKAAEADRDLYEAQQHLNDIARKAASDEFTVADNNLRKVLDVLAKTSAAYIAAVAELGPAHAFNVRDQALVRAKSLGARLAVADLPKPTPDILQAHRAATLTVEWLNSRLVRM